MENKIKVKRRSISVWNSPYTFCEKLQFAKYRVLAPKSKPQNSIPYKPISCGKYNIVSSTKGYSSNYSIAFLGDFMPLHNNKPIYSPELMHFCSTSNAVIINLEGVITTSVRPFAQTHSLHGLLEFRNKVGTEVVINLANNHSADFGKSIFSEQCELLQRNSFRFLGLGTTPFLLSPTVQLQSATQWSNQVNEVVNKLSTTQIEEYTLNGTQFAIFLPHWGYEMHLYPSVTQQKHLDLLINRGWDAVVGSHPHTPQPIAFYRNKLVAFSLGNFCYGNVNPNHWGGVALKLSLENTQIGEKPQLLSVEHYYTHQHIHRGIAKIELVNELNYRRLRKQLWRTNPLRYINDLFL